MDWLRSEDLNEEKGVTTSDLTLTRRGNGAWSETGAGIDSGAKLETDGFYHRA